MDAIFPFFGTIAIIAVGIVLLLGLWNMMKDGSASRSQNLMRWRVGLQFLAVCLLMLGLYFKAG